MKIRPAFEDASIPTKPQLHTRKHHNAYNGARSLPLFTWVRPCPPRIHASTRGTRGTRGNNLGKSRRTRSASGSGSSQSNLSAAAAAAYSSPSTTASTSHSTTPEEIYEIKLYYPHNRSCTIYRTVEDFLRLRKGLSSSRYIALSSPSSTTVNSNGICPERHSHNSACLHKFLKYVMERCPTGMGKEIEPAIEFFLRRRIDDCGGGGGGCG